MERRFKRGDSAMTPGATFDKSAFKAATREAWNAHASGWDRYGSQIRNWLRQSTDAMIHMAQVQRGARVLDVAAGAGDQTLDLADRVGPTGFVLATDLSPAILQLAAENARAAGYCNVETKVADGEYLTVAECSFDAVVCRLGLMFFPEPSLGLQAMYRALKPGGRACTMVFSGPERNPCIAILVSTAMKHAGLPLRDPYQPGSLLSLGKPRLIDDLFQAAGFAHVATTTVAAPFKLTSVKDYLDFIRNSASPIMQILGKLDDSGRDAAWRDIEDRLRAFDTSGGWEGPNELLLTVGQRPG